MDIPCFRFCGSRACLLNLPSYSSFTMNREEVEKRYLRFTKMFGACSGVWPFQSKRNRNLLTSVIFVIALLGLYTQTLRVIVFFSVDIIMEQCPFFIATAGIIFKILNYQLNHQKVKDLFNDIYDDWEVKRTPAETEIMHEYGKRGLLFTIIYIALAIFGSITFVMLPTTGVIVKYFVSNRNATVYRIYIYPAYYPFDEDRYYIYFWAHMTLVIFTVAVVYTACDSLYVYCVQHACGLLAVAGYRFKSAVENYANDEKESVKAMDIVYNKVCISVHGHKHALSFVKNIQGVHSTYLAFAVALVIGAFSVTLVKTSIMEVGLEFYKYCGFLVLQLVHLLFLTIQGQFVLNAYDQIYDEIYEGLWYNSSSRTQRVYVLALRGSLTAPLLSAGGLLTLNLATFAEVLKASVSYFTVLKSQ